MPNDDEIARALKQSVGDPEQFRIFDAHHSAIRGYLRHRVGDIGIVEDLAAETFARRSRLAAASGIEALGSDLGSARSRRTFSATNHAAAPAGANYSAGCGQRHPFSSICLRTQTRPAPRSEDVASPGTEA